jgi:hypothetical protein
MAQFVVTGITLAGRRSIQLHVQCFQLWDAERASESNGDQRPLSRYVSTRA